MFLFFGHDFWVSFFGAAACEDYTICIEEAFFFGGGVNFRSPDVG